MIIQADARSIPLIDGCVQTCVTSPPYWGLRTYGYEQQIGLEASPELYVAEMVAVFREVRRVLKADGTLWLNLGDSYAREAGKGEKFRGGRLGADLRGSRSGVARMEIPESAKGKDLVGIPWLVAFALRADGWFLRSDVIWNKPNPMPESVTDRPTRAHEYIFLLSKSARYHYDAAAIAEPVSGAMLLEMAQGYDGLGLKNYDAAGAQNPSSVKARIIAGARRKSDAVGENGRNVQATNPESERRDQIGSFNNNPRKRYGGKWATAAPQDASRRILENTAAARGAGAPHDSPFGITRNRRSVWTVPTSPYSGAHFATFPEALIEPCILAGCPVGGLVFDPFLGSGTVGAVAERLGRRWVGTDLSYQDLAKERTAQRGIPWGCAGAEIGA